MVNCKQLGLYVLSYGVNACVSLAAPHSLSQKTKPEKVVVKLLFLLGVFNFL